MSIAGDLLTSATPTRLLCRRGTWVLESVRLVALDRNVFQPRTQRVEGSEAVLQHLKRNADSPVLASAAVQLIRGLRSDEERSFEAVDGEWVPSEPGARRDTSRPSAPPPGSSVACEVADLRAELMILRASHERLRERVIRLESLLVDGAPREVFTTTATPSLVPRKVSLAPNPVEPFAHGLEPLAATLAQGQAPPAPKPAQPAIAVHTAVKLPTLGALNACLHGLIGDAMTAREKRPAKFDPAPGELYWVSRLIDEEGLDVGMIAADLAATTSLGGTLMMLPEGEIQAQRAAKTPSQDAIDAMSEVCNNLSGTINQVAGTIRVRVKAIEVMTSELAAWAQASGRTLEMELVGDKGRLFLFAH
jgi:hypothetical protein